MSTISVNRRTGWRYDPRWRRLGASLLIGLVLALMTVEEQGSSDDYTRVFDAAILNARVIWFLLLGVALWLVLEFKEPLRALTRRVSTAATGARDEVMSRKHARPLSITLLVILGFLLLIVYPATLSPFWQRVLVDQIGIYVLLAVGLNVVVGWAGLLDLGYVAFFAIGAYSTAYWTGALPIEPLLTLNPFLVLPLAVLTTMTAGVLLGFPVLRLRGDYLAIVTLGFHEIVRIYAVNADSVTNGPRGAFGIPHFSIDIGPIEYEWKLDSLPYWYLLLFFTALIVIAFRRLDNSRIGRMWVAIREDEVAAAANGVPTVKYKLLAFAIGASTSGFAGVLYASKVGFINPDNFLLILSIYVVSYVIFGGMGSLWGVIIGSAFLAWLPQFLRDIVDPRDRIMYLGALLVVMMIYRPQGLLPSKRRSRELVLAEEGVGSADAMSAPTGGKVS